MKPIWIFAIPWLVLGTYVVFNFVFPHSRFSVFQETLPGSALYGVPSVKVGLSLFTAAVAACAVCNGLSFLLHVFTPSIGSGWKLAAPLLVLVLSLSVYIWQVSIASRPDREFQFRMGATCDEILAMNTNWMTECPPELALKSERSGVIRLRSSNLVVADRAEYAQALFERSHLVKLTWSASRATRSSILTLIDSLLADGWSFVKGSAADIERLKQNEFAVIELRRLPSHLHIHASWDLPSSREPESYRFEMREVR